MFIGDPLQLFQLPLSVAAPAEDSGDHQKDCQQGLDTQQQHRCQDGDYSQFVANDAAIEALNINASDNFTVTVSDGALTDSKTLSINISQQGSTESLGNDVLTGTTGSA